MIVDLDQFSAVVASIHRAATEPDHWADALAATAQLLGSDRAGIFELDAPSLTLKGTVARVGHDESVQLAYERHYYTVDPTMPLGLAQAPLTPLVVYEHFDKTARSRSEYFNFARASGFGDTLGFSTSDIHGSRFVLTLHRPVDAPPFDTDAKSVIQHIATHFQIARRVSAQTAALQSQSAELAAAFDHLAAALFIVDRGATIRRHNHAAEEMLARGRPAIARQGKLAFQSSRLNAAFSAALERAARENGQSSALRLSSTGHEGGELLIAPLQSGAFAEWTQPLALVALIEPAPNLEQVAGRMRDLYALTAAEARVAAMVALGRTVKEMARANGVTEATLRTQLRSIFDKTGTARQAELVQRALAGSLWHRSR
jgi:DNA-binding CsgD family transcriptional regulator